MAWQISTELANETVLNPSGESHRLGDSWLQKPAVLVFIRHFG